MQEPASVAETSASPAPLVELKCRHGNMLVFRNDNVIGRSLSLYGEWAEHELRCLRRYVRPGSTVVDVGAHVGTHTLAFSRWVGGGKVIAVEAQPVVSSVLTVNCLLNNCWNIEVVNCLCSRRPGTTTISIDYRRSDNFGGVTFVSPADLLRERIARRFRSHKSPRGTAVAIRTLDELAVGEAISLVKLDVEGMELAVLQGASRLLRHTQPALYIEQLDTLKLRQIHSLLSRLDYRLYWLETQPFNRNNYRGVAENIWWRTETGILAVGRELPRRHDLVEARPDDREVPKRLDPRGGVFLDDEIAD
jgi:FkbM family methyltransferase